MNEKVKKVGLFIGITFALSWLIVILFLAFGGKWGTPSAMVMATAFMFTPMTSAILVQKFIHKEPLKEPLGISFKLNRWWLVAWLLPPLIVFATIGVSLLIPGITYSPEMTGFFERFEGIMPPEQLQQMKEQITAFPIHIFWIVLILGLFAGITINAVAGFGEELGWRGFLLREFGYMGFWRSSAIIGLIWGIWHVPIILQGHNYPQHPVEGAFMMILFCLLLTPVFNYIRLKSKSVIAAAILHGSLNATAGLAIMILKGGNDLIIGVTGTAGFIVLLIVNLCIFLFASKPELSKLSKIKMSELSKMEIERFKRKIIRIKSELDDVGLISQLMRTELAKVPYDYQGKREVIKRLTNVEKARKSLAMELEKAGSLTPEALKDLASSAQRLKDDFEDAKKMYNDFVRALESARLPGVRSLARVRESK